MMAIFFGAWEWFLIFAVVLILVGTKRWPDFRRGFREGASEFGKHFFSIGAETSARFGRPVADALTENKQTAEVQDPAALREVEKAKQKAFSMIVWIAQGFGIGRLKPGPGTWGSLLGLGWFAALLATGSVAWFVIGAVAGVLASVWLCGAAEQILGQRDPGSVVLDEVAAIPFCFGAWVVTACLESGRLPGPEHFFSAENWLKVVLVFGAFRFFDIVKPWPVQQSQSLPGGWGVTIDDLLAAGYVNVVWAGVAWMVAGR